MRLSEVSESVRTGQIGQGETVRNVRLFYRTGRFGHPGHPARRSGKSGTYAALSFRLLVLIGHVMTLVRCAI